MVDTMSDAIIATIIDTIIERQEWRLEKSPIGEIPPNQGAWRDIECGIPCRHTGWQFAKFIGVAMFDDDIGAGGRVRIDGAAWCGHIQRHTVRGRGQRDAICADLVGHIAVGCDPVRSTITRSTNPCASSEAAAPSGNTDTEIPPGPTPTP